MVHNNYSSHRKILQIIRQCDLSYLLLYTDYLSNDVEVIDLNIPVTVVHLDQNHISADSQLSTTIYDMDSVPNQDFPLSYSNSEATDQGQISEQLSLAVSCDKDQNNLDNSNNDVNEQSICETTTVGSS